MSLIISFLLNDTFDLVTKIYVIDTYNVFCRKYILMFTCVYHLRKKLLNLSTILFTYFLVVLSKRKEEKCFEKMGRE